MTEEQAGRPSRWERLSPVRAFGELRREYDRAVLVLAVGDLVASFGFALIFPFLTIYLTTNLGASTFEAGLMLAIYAVCSIASNAVGGWLADRIGRRAVMIASIAVTAAVIVAMGQAPDFRTIAALTVLLGLADPAFIPAARAAVADVVDEARRPRAFALLGVAQSVGWIAGPAIGAGLAAFGYPLLFTVAGLVIGIYTFILIAFMRETRPSEAAIAEAHRREAGAGQSRPEVAYCGLDCDRPHVHRYAEPPMAASSGPAVAAVDPRLVLAAFIVLAIVLHATTFQWVVTLPVHAVRALGQTSQTWGLLFSLNGVMIVLFQLRISAFFETRSKPRLLAIGGLAYALGYLVVAFIPGAPLAVPLLALTIVLVTVGEMLFFPIEPAFVSDLSPIEARGRYQGIYGAAVGAGSAIGPPLGGYILDAAPGATLWLITAGATVAGSAGLWLLGRWVDRLPRPEEAGGRLPRAATS